MYYSPQKTKGPKGRTQRAVGPATVSRLDVVDLPTSVAQDPATYLKPNTHILKGKKALCYTKPYVSTRFDGGAGMGAVRELNANMGLSQLNSGYTSEMRQPKRVFDNRVKLLLREMDGK